MKREDKSQEQSGDEHNHAEDTEYSLIWSNIDLQKR